jgi:hypothetical protein
MKQLGVLQQAAAERRAFYTPAHIAARWSWHEESVRRAIRQRRMGSVVVGRRRLVPVEEIERVEREGFIARAA